jgi:hypothetical protein
MANLTKTQIYTLRRMKSGTPYLMRGDGKKAIERRREVSSSMGFDDVNAPSIPVLVRAGLVAFKQGEKRDSTRYYTVILTAAGLEAANTLTLPGETPPAPTLEAHIASLKQTLAGPNTWGYAPAVAAVLAELERLQALEAAKVIYEDKK